MDSFFPTYWWKGTMKDFQYSDTNQDQLGFLLFNKLEQLAITNNIKIIILFQADRDSTAEHVNFFKKYQEYIEKNLPHLKVCNTLTELVSLKNEQPIHFEQLFKIDGEGHMSSEGNAYIAAILKKFISK